MLRPLRILVGVARVGPKCGAREDRFQPKSTHRTSIAGCTSLAHSESQLARYGGTYGQRHHWHDRPDCCGGHRPSRTGRDLTIF